MKRATLPFARNALLRPHAPIRFAHNAPNKPVPLYDVTPLVLDLDAHEGRFIRTYDEVVEKHETERASRRQRTIVDKFKRRVLAFEAEEKSNQLSRDVVSKNAFDANRVTDVDLLDIALQGVPRSDGPRRGLGNILTANGIPRQAFKSSESAIRHLVRCWNEALPPLLKRDDLSLDGGLTEQFRTALNRCQDVLAFQRFLAHASQTPTGCSLICENGPHLISFYQMLAEKESTDKPSMARMILALLSDFEANARSKKLPTGEALCHAGILHASAQFAIPSLQTFLQHGMERGYYGVGQSAQASEVIRDVMLALLNASTPELSPYVDQTLHFTKPDVFMLLTGVDFSGSSQWQGLRYLIGRDGPLYPYYLQLLVRLGAFRTLWHEWHSSIPQSALAQELSQDKAVVFASFRLLSHKGSGSAMADDHMTGKYIEDCVLDLQELAASNQTFATNERVRPDLPITEGIRSSVEDALETRHPPESLKAIRRLFT